MSSGVPQTKLSQSEVPEYLKIRFGVDDGGLATKIGNLSAQEARSLVREVYPDAANFVPNNIRITESRELLLGQCSLDDVTARISARMSGGSGEKTPKSPPAGVSVVGSGDDDDDGDESLETLIKIAGAIGRGDLCDYLQDLRERAGKAGQQAAMAMPKVPEAVGGSFDVCGFRMPVIHDAASIDGSKDWHHWVPSVDDQFNLDAWTSRIEVGVSSFAMDAGDLARLLLADTRVMLQGLTGCGKTAAIRQIAALAKWPLYRLNGSRDTTIDAYIGAYEAVAGVNGPETVWQDGLAVMAAKAGGILLLDDFDRVPAECAQPLAPLLEKHGMLVIPQTGEVVKPHPNFRIVGTCNAGFHGDETGTFTAAQVQDAQTISRWDAVFRVQYPSAEHEQMILCAKTGVSADDAEKIVKVANQTRSGVQRGDLNYPVDVRQTLAWATTSVVLGDLGAAFALCVLAKSPASEAPAVSEIAQRVLGGDLGS